MAVTDIGAFSWKSANGSYCVQADLKGSDFVVDRLQGHKRSPALAFTPMGLPRWDYYAGIYCLCRHDGLQAL